MRKTLALIIFAVSFLSVLAFATEYIEYNPFTGKLDATCEGNSYISHDGTNYELDISTTVHISGELHGGPSETEGWKLIYDGTDLKLYLNDTLVETWTVDLGGYLLTEAGDNLTNEAGEKLLWE